MKKKKPEAGPPILYHYTSQEGLLGIVQNNNRNMKLWCTEIRYLNDTSEFKYCIDLLQELMIEDNSPNPGGDERYEILNPAIKLAKTSMDSHESEVKNYLFVFCFSSEKDCLSQWRGYCPDGTGFCLGFNFAKLNYLAIDQNYRFVECIYDRDDQVRMTKRLIYESSELSKKIRPAYKRGKFTETEKKLILGLFPSEFFTNLESVDHLLKSDLNYLIQSFILETYLKLVTMAPQFKDPTFKTEHEWRLVSHMITQVPGGNQARLNNEITIKFRKGKSMIIPYVEFRLTDEKGQNCPINEVIIGPTPHTDLSRQSVKSLLNQNGLDTCKVSLSKIPYRAW